MDSRIAKELAKLIRQFGAFVNTLTDVYASQLEEIVEQVDEGYDHKEESKPKVRRRR